MTRSPLVLVLVLVLVPGTLACGPASPPPAHPHNHVAPSPPAPGQRLTPVALEEISDCKAPHPIDIIVDDVVQTTVIVPCPPPPPPPRPGQVVVISTDDSPEYRGQPVTISPGHHHLVARDRLTGLSHAQDYEFPVREDGQSLRRPLADTIFVIVHADWIRVSVVVESHLIDI